MKYFDQENSNRGVAVVPVGGDVLTLTGATGTATVTVNGVAYLATFGDDLSDTAGDFVTSHRAALLLRGIDVSAAAAVLTFTHKRSHIVTNRVAVTIANVSGDLAGTVAGTFTPDFNTARVYQLSISSAVTIAKALNLRDGQAVRFEITATGTFAVTWNAAYQFAGGTEHTQTASGLDILKGNYNKAADKVYLTLESSDVKV